MSNELSIHRGRTEVLTVSLMFDISQDIITSEIRAGRSKDTPLIATWKVKFLTDGTDGKLVFTLDDSITKNIKNDRGYMDIKRISGGEPFEVFEDPLVVTFKDVVTP